VKLILQFFKVTYNNDNINDQVQSLVSLRADPTVADSGGRAISGNAVSNPAGGHDCVLWLL